MDIRRSPTSSPVQDENKGAGGVVIRPPRPREPPAPIQRISSAYIPELDPMFQPDTSPDIAGMLHKKGRRLKVWKQRYFEVQGTNMYYFKNEKSRGECLGYIDLTKLYFVGKSTAASFGAPFELQTTGRVHLLAARSDSDRDKWINAIKSKLVADAKVRRRRGTKADVNAVFQNQERRATIKYKGGKPAPPPPASGTKLRKSSIPEEPTVITSSQSFPEFTVQKPIVGQSPSHQDIPTLAEEDSPAPSPNVALQKQNLLSVPTSQPPPPDSSTSPPPPPPPASQAAPSQPAPSQPPPSQPPPSQPAPSQPAPSPPPPSQPVPPPSQPSVPLSPAPPLSSSDLQPSNEAPLLLEGIPSPDTIGQLPPPPVNQPTPFDNPPLVENVSTNKRSSILDDLPSPDEIGMHPPLGDLPKRSSILDDLPSPDEIGVHPPLGDLPKRSSILDDLPSPDELNILSPPPPIGDIPASTTKRSSILDDLPSPDEIATMPQDLPASKRSSIFDELPLPDEISMPQDLPTGKRSSILDDLPSPDEVGLPHQDLPTSNKRSSILDDLPSPDELNMFPSTNVFPATDTSPPLISIESGVSEGVPPPQAISPPLGVQPLSPALIPPDPSDSEIIKRLKELLNQDDSSWKVPYDEALLPPMNTQWMQKDSAIDQLGHFLQVCP